MGIKRITQELSNARVHRRYSYVSKWGRRNRDRIGIVRFMDSSPGDNGHDAIVTNSDSGGEKAKKTGNQ